MGGSGCSVKIMLNLKLHSKSKLWLLTLVHSKMKETEILLNVYFSLENSQLIILLEYFHKVNDSLIIDWHLQN